MPYYYDLDWNCRITREDVMERFDDLSMTDILAAFGGNAYHVTDLLPEPLVEEVMADIVDTAIHYDEDLFMDVLGLFLVDGEYYTSDSENITYEEAKELMEEATLDDVIRTFSGNAYTLFDIIAEPVVEDILEEIKEQALNDQELFFQILNIEIREDYQ